MARWMIRKVRSKLPGTRRKPSCVAAVAPSRLIDIRCRPTCCRHSMARSVTSGVADGDRATVNPSDRAKEIISNKSGRLNGSPPVNTNSGGRGNSMSCAISSRD